MTQIRTAGNPRFVAVGRKIRAARTGVGLSQERFAEKIGSSRRHVMRLERGDHQPSAPTVKRISEVTGKPESFFADDDEEADPVDDFLRALTDRLRELREHEPAVRAAVLINSEPGRQPHQEETPA